ncbi:MAG: alpha-mannosidase, partial [Defluviitaleaceae bacterium]|nr:alpha-mannosidase [Defluviitaleaceae bacterium]
MKDVYLIGNAHIDPVWLWRKPEGLSEILATFKSALDRMAEFDDYVFTSACAAYYKWVLQVDPAMFAEIKNRMMEGRWSVVGGFWVQPDCNIPTGESFVRHLLYSQQFFIDNLWVKATVGYNVDSFGHNGSMPQILNKAGIGAYVFMRPDAGENPDIPGDMFEWESPDGSSVTALRISNGYGTWEAYEDKSGIESDSCRDKALAAFEAAKRDGMPRLCFYGIGNHGGGPSIRCLKTYERLIAERGDFCFSSVPFFLSDMKDAGRLGGLKKWKSDLQHHASGCYSANSQIKAANRRCEHALVAAEKYLALSSALAPADDFNVLNARLREAWEKVLFNQFHDILAGCSIREACDDALKEFASAEEAAAAVRDLALHRISWRIDTRRRSDIFPAQKNGWLLWEIPGEGAPAVVFNPHSFALKWPVQINAKVVGIADGDGAPVESQTVRGPQTNGSDMLNTIFLADIPALGYATYYLSADCADGQKLTGASASVNALENEFVKVTFDALTGFISGMFDKECGRELLCGPSARPVVINDEKSDTWAHGIFEFADEAGEFRLAEIAVLENGPVRAAVRVRSVYGNSELTQDFQLFSGGRELIVRCRLDYRERLKMLKLSFNVKADSPRAVYSMPFGFI